MRRGPIWLAAAAVLLAGCGGAHGGGGGVHRGGGGPGTGGSTAGRPQLLALLGVLRRPRTPSDTTPALTAVLRRLAHEPGCAAELADPGLTRHAGSLPGGAGLYLVAFRRARCEPRCVVPGCSAARPQPEVEWATLFAESARYWYMAGFWTARDIVGGQAQFTFPRRFAGRLVTVAVVRDGVSHLAMEVGPLDHPPTHTVSIPVRANVAWLATAPGTNVELARG